MKETKLLINFLTALLVTAASQPSFAHYGPRGLLGGTPHVGIQYNGNVYLGTEDAGVFESTNTQLVGWRLRAVGLKTGEITALAHSGAELYAGTADGGVYIFNGSVGSDRYWNERNNGLSNLNVLSLMAIDANTIFAGTDGGGLFKTSDKGLNWSAVNSTSLNGKDVTALTKGGSRLFALVRDGGVFKSDDNGATWSGLNDANTLNKTASEYFTYNATTDQLLVSNVSGLFVLSSAAGTASPSYTATSTGLPGPIHIHGLTNNGSKWFVASHSGVFQAPSSAISWTSASTGLPNNELGAIVAIDDTLIVGIEKYGVYKSNANTISWSQFNTGMTNVNVSSIACKGDSLVVTATEYGVTVSTNIGNNPAIRNSGLTDSLGVTDVEIADNMLFAATANLGVFMSSNSGNTWTAQNAGLTNMDIARIVYGSGRMYAIDAGGNLYQSGLPAISWAMSSSGLPSGAVATSIAFYGNNVVLGTYGNGVFVRHKDSTTWMAFNNGLANMNVTSVTYSAGKLFAGTDGAGVFVSSASAAAWSATSAVAIPFFNTVAIDPSRILYMTAIREYVVASVKGGVMATSDGGMTWEEAGTQFNLPTYTDINKISCVTSRIFVTTETNNAQSNGMAEFDYDDSMLVVQDETVNAPASGMESFHSITSNVKWKVTSSDSWVVANVDSGFWSGNIKLTITPNTGAARMATVTVKGDTFTRTIMVSQGDPSGIANTNYTGIDVKVFPNPNTGRFVIDAGSAIHSVSLFNVAGKLVKHISINNKNTVEIAEKLVPGTYLLRIASEQGSTTRNIIVE